MQILSLERFDEPEAPDTSSSGLYREGFLAGVAQAEAEAEAAQAVLRAELVQAIGDFQFTYAEARSAFLSSLEPLLMALPEKILPAAVDTAFALQIGQALSNAARNSSPERMTIKVHPSAYDAVKATVLESGIDLTVNQDNALSANAILIGQTSSETFVDFDALSDEITAILSAIAQPREVRDKHG